MRNYWRMMEQVTLSDQKKEEIMEMLENKDARKHRMPKAGKIALAAALAVGCVLSIAAGLPAQVYNFVSGGVTVVDDSGSGEIKIGLTGEDPAAPIVLEDGRLWLSADGQKVDITDQMDEDTPYIFERTDPDTKQKGYVVAGGTVDDYGWAEFFLTENGACSMVGENAWENMIPIDGKDIPLGQLTEDQLDALNEDGGVLCESVYRPWLNKALEQLGLEMDLAVEG